MISIRKVQEADFDAIWHIFRQVVQQGNAYAYDPESTREQAHALWMSEYVTSYVACVNDEVVGAYFLRPNQPCLGAHVANAGYMVKADQQGKGIGRAMGEHSLEEARQLGFLAMQFNMVVSTNESAVVLWQKLGFAIVGTIPKAFRHREFGLVDAYIMHRFL